jgi:D-alanyl-D-alanine dipeptidase
VSAEVTLIADPRVLAIPIQECGEPLVDLREVPGIAIDERKRDGDDVWLLARLGVARRVRAIQQACPSGLRLLLIEAYRPLDVQRRYFEEYAARLAVEHPEWDPPTLRLNASRYVAPPDIDPPHSTGGAIDVTLADEDGGELDMGTPVNASPEASGGACFTAAPGLDPLARANRALLSELMGAAGFVNYGTEWWHWSYGDRYWAFSGGHHAACYGAAALIPSRRRLVTRRRDRPRTPRRSRGSR